MDKENQNKNPEVSPQEYRRIRAKLREVGRSGLTEKEKKIMKPT